MINKSKRSGLMVSTTLCGALLSAVALTAITSVVPTVAVAQDLTSGTLYGTVKSEEGKPAAGATVVITGESTGYTTTSKTDADGVFQVSQIPLGRYTVAITTASGAKAEETVLVTLGARSSYEFTAGGSSVETVVVRGKARRNLDFDRTTRGAVLDVQTVSERLPVGRTIEALADLVPGITINDVFGPPSIAGASPAENIYYINGMNVTNFRTFLGGTTVPFDFYEQIEVKTGGYSAEYGRSTGGAFIATTRSGSNSFKGGAAVYLQPEALASKGEFTYSELYGEKTRRDYPDNAEANFWLSGPVLKDHIYFFAFYNPRDLKDRLMTYKTSTGGFEYSSEAVRDEPFWGGKLDFVLNPQHRLEYTYFSDDQTDARTTTYSDGSVVPSDNFTGGVTRIVKYTGKFTDWFTLSAMYGNSTYNQTSSSALDAEANVFLDGQIVRGNPSLLINQGKDDRKNYRIDADFYFNFLGKHHVKVGADQEKLFAADVSSYSGGVYYRYYTGATNCGGYGTVTNSCVRVRKYFNGGEFNIQNEAFYIQDSWEITDRLALNLGLRSDSFDNKNAAGASFLKIENKISPRIGLSYDPTGDKTSKLTAFYGRYYLPIAANTNLRLAGGENFTQDFYEYTSRDATTLVPTLGTLYGAEILSNGQIPDAATLVSGNLDPQYQDEFIVGYERRLESGWKFGVDFTYRKLSAVMEDADIDYTGAAAYLASTGVITAAEAASGSFGGSGYVLINPGKDLVVKLGDSFGASAGKTVTVPASELGFPEAIRNYQAVTFSAERPWDGTWFLGGSLTLSRSYGNIEGGVKSDNGQDDTGLTQDFDEPGWTDGSKGLLPNHHGYNLKLFGSYEFTENLRGGFNASIISPRKYGCIGAYPNGDGRASPSTITAWYCGGKLTPRGESFDGDWIKKLDVNLTWSHPIPIGTVKISADVFNVFNFQGAEQYDEFGETSLLVPSADYRKPTSYQNPRYVRIGLKYEF